MEKKKRKGEGLVAVHFEGEEFEASSEIIDFLEKERREERQQIAEELAEKKNLEPIKAYDKPRSIFHPEKKEAEKSIERVWKEEDREQREREET